MKLEIEVRRDRKSVTQGFATVMVNGLPLVSFGDEIEIIHPGETYYGPLIGDWASRKPDVTFILAAFWHPMDNIEHLSDKAKGLIERLYAMNDPARIREKKEEHAE